MIAKKIQTRRLAVLRLLLGVHAAVSLALDATIDGNSRRVHGSAVLETSSHSRMLQEEHASDNENFTCEDTSHSDDFDCTCKDDAVEGPTLTCLERCQNCGGAQPAGGQEQPPCAQLWVLEQTNPQGEFQTYTQCYARNDAEDVCVTTTKISSVEQRACSITGLGYDCACELIPCSSDGLEFDVVCTPILDEDKVNQDNHQTISSSICDGDISGSENNILYILNNATGGAFGTDPQCVPPDRGNNDPGLNSEQDNDPTSAASGWATSKVFMVVLAVTINAV